MVWKWMITISIVSSEMLLNRGPMRHLEESDEEEEAKQDPSIYVKYDRLLHGDKRTRGATKELLNVRFLKKYITYAKERWTPQLTKEVRQQPNRLHFRRSMCSLFPLCVFHLFQSRKSNCGVLISFESSGVSMRGTISGVRRCELPQPLEDPQ
jgi:hypothetical protein